MAKSIDQIIEENNGDTQKLRAHGLTVRTFDGVGLRLLRHDDFAPRQREPFNSEQVELLVIVENSTRSNSAVAIAIVYDTNDFPCGEMSEVARKLSFQFETHVAIVEYPTRNPFTRAIRLTLWKGVCDRVPPVHTLIHVLDTSVPMTEAIRRRRERQVSAPNGVAHYEDWAAK
jgi:hypothetical protein